MRRIFLGFVATAVALMGLAINTVPARADGGPHKYTATPSATTDGCASCHRVHTAQGSHLLKQAEPFLCYSCHGQDAEGANNDVVDGVGYVSYGNPTGSYDPHRTGNGGSCTWTAGVCSGYVQGAPIGALRGGGFQYALIGSGTPTGQQTDPTLQASLNTGNIPVLTLPGSGPIDRTGLAASTSAHSVDGTAATAWGNGGVTGTANYGATVSLRCGSCHDPHGNGNYRLLRPIPLESGTGSSVNIPDETTDTGFSKAYITTNYWDNRSYEIKMTSATTWTYQLAPYTSFIPNISAWCTTCHTRFLAGSGSGEVNSGDAVYTYVHTSNGTSQGTPNCIQCHVAHGSNASMGTGQSSLIVNPDGTGTTGNSFLLRINNRGTCEMCHKR